MEYNLSNKLTKSNSLKSIKKGKSYTIEDIKDLTSNGYIIVTQSLWEYIPARSHVRYVKAGNENIEKRFKPGGFVKNHFTNENGKKGLVLENKLGGKNGDAGYISFPIVFEDIEKIWKKYPYDSFIEIHLIYNSLAAKKTQLDTLAAEIASLKEELALLKKIK